MESLSNHDAGARPITRFAPSPTGPLHLGHAYAALVAHGLARTGGGRFLVRIEDLDKGRSRSEFERGIFEDLEWLGLTPDAIATRQSERMSIYAAALARLDADGLVYPCFCTRREIAAEIANAGEAPQGAHGAAYPGTCRNLSAAEREVRRDSGADFALRLDTAAALARAARSGELAFTEAWAMDQAPSRVAARPDLQGDIVLARKEFPASYHLAVVIDDAEATVSHVTRGEDLLEAAHVQVLLQRLLRLPHPIYAHHALVRDEAGGRLAKRDRARSLAALRAEGWTPDDVRRALPALPDFETALTSY